MLTHVTQLTAVLWLWLWLWCVLQYMTALMQCHKDHFVAKWWGACNDEHWALTRCLAEEKTIVR
jgi:hypothetical protein